MSFKNKLVMGAMSATLGISLVAGGTWAAFNDIETNTGSMAAGELNLELAPLSADQPYEFLVSNLKPGDSMKRALEFKNTGTLAIKDVLMSIELVEFGDYAPTEAGMAGYGDTWAADHNTSALDFLDQFQVSVIQLGEPNATDTYPKNILLQNVSLKDFYLASDSVDPSNNKFGATETEINQAKIDVFNKVRSGYIKAGDDRLVVSTIDENGYYGIPVSPNDSDKLEIEIEFVKNDTAKYEDGTHEQNIYQGDSVDLKVAFEASQWDGQDVSDEDGEIESNKNANNGEDF
ncbi:TasA family protein [Cytobacillus sp. FJAT-54145]|uniref:TasA family protein n=1 Tax=Cytobacillus spartinae TaxID=3299023 RepID=A0ABW6KFX1_9BACI